MSDKSSDMISSAHSSLVFADPLPYLNASYEFED